MPFRVSNAFFEHIVAPGVGEVYAMLVGDSAYHPQHVGKFVGEVEGFARFGTLVSVGASYYAGNLAHFLRQHGHIRQG